MEKDKPFKVAFFQASEEEVAPKGNAPLSMILLQGRSKSLWEHKQPKYFVGRSSTFSVSFL